MGNCCAFGFMPKMSEGAKPSCCAAKHSDGKKNEEHQNPCCTKGAATAPLPSNVKAPGNDSAPLLTVMPPAALLAFHFSTHDAEVLALDTGPPGALSFAVLVLQRSLLSHAPPVVV